MKAITIWQPWATLIAIGAKQYETRSWKTDYRGKIAIHTAAKDPCRMPLLGLEEFEKAVKEVLPGCTWCQLPKGKIIATAELVNVWYIVAHPGTNIDKAKHIPIGAESLTTDKHAPDFSDYFIPTEKEMLFGDWTPGRYAWELSNIQMLSEPIRAKGKQRLWNWEC